MMTTTKSEAGFTVSIVLSNGTVAGVGFAGTEVNALWFACRDALANGFADAACGHAVNLPESDEIAIRVMAKRADLTKRARLFRETNARKPAGMSMLDFLATLTPSEWTAYFESKNADLALVMGDMFPEVA